ncbi:MAG: methyltransferase [Rubrivivax sp.]|nr:methyltransferase [Rubrivivax sp.]
MLQAALFPDHCVDDALGAAFCEGTSPALRRSEGITLTPEWLVDAMVDRVAGWEGVQTVVDAGAGSGRFCIAAARRLPQAHIVAVERSPRMLELLRGNLCAKGLTNRVTVVEGDFRSAVVPRSGRTVYIGNPPFVRHHDIEPEWKDWYRSGMHALGIQASQLAGLHAHFLLRIVQGLQPGDRFCLVAAAEWLDNGYGSALRSLLTSTQTHLRGLWVAPPREPVFPDALVSAAVFEAECTTDTGSAHLGVLGARTFATMRTLPVAELASAKRWTELCQPQAPTSAAGIEVGDLFRVIRGQVTGLNTAWVLPSESALLPAALTLPAVTRAREIIDGTVSAPGALQRLKRVVNLPHELDTVAPDVRPLVDVFLGHARAQGAASGYVARQRRHWHALDLRPPPAAFVSYMGRRPPVFCLNPYAVSYLNIAHGLYPRTPVAQSTLERILTYLNAHTGLYSGRVYGGGLAKFEPSDVARLRIPPEALAERA